MTGRTDGAQRRAERRQARAARRDARWERPPAPKDWRYFVGGLGRILIVIGVLMFGFVAYQLWGTGLEYAQAQDRLDDELDELFAGASTTPSDPTTPTTITTTIAPPTAAGPTATLGPGTATSDASAVPTTSTTTIAPAVTVPVPPLEAGDAIARIEIPTIDLDAVVVAGVAPSDLKKGPGHYPGTPMPGQLGNSAIAGHRTTYGQPFFDLDDIDPGEEIVVTTVQGRFVYRMTASEVVPPGAGEVVLTTDPDVAKLTLTTCDPKYTATNRLILYADLDTVVSGPGLPPILDYGGEGPPRLPGESVPANETTAPPATPPTTSAVAGPASTTADGATTTTRGEGAPAGTSTGSSEPGGTEPPVPTVPGAEATAPTVAGGVAGEGGGADGDPTAVDAFSHGWFSDSAAWLHVIGWGLLGTAVVVGGYFVARTFRRYWVGIAAAAVPFVVTLYFFYQNVNRLLPAAI